MDHFQVGVKIKHVISNHQLDVIYIVVSLRCKKRNATPQRKWYHCLTTSDFGILHLGSPRERQYVTPLLKLPPVLEFDIYINIIQYSIQET